MDINQLRTAVNSLSPAQIQDFSSEAQLRYGINELLGKATQKHLLAAAESIIKERMSALGIKPRVHKHKREAVVHTIDRRQKPGGHNGRVMVTKVNPKEMEKLWQT